MGTNSKKSNNDVRTFELFCIHIVFCWSFIKSNLHISGGLIHVVSILTQFPFFTLFDFLNSKSVILYNEIIISLHK